MPCQEHQCQAAKAEMNRQRRAPRVLGPIPPLLLLEGWGGDRLLLVTQGFRQVSGC